VFTQTQSLPGKLVFASIGRRGNNSSLAAFSGSVRQRGKLGVEVMDKNKIALVAVLCAVVFLLGCRREESYEPLKLGGPGMQRPAR
jgi:hypothetical protein